MKGNLDWNDLKYFLTIYDKGSLVAAARQLKVDETTVGRRLQCLETAVGARLLQKVKAGYILTEAGEQVMSMGTLVRDQIQDLQNRLGTLDSAPRGKVRLTMPDTMVSHLMLPKLEHFFEQYPTIRLEILSGSDLLNIQKSEADLALRMVRPTQESVYAKPFGRLRFVPCFSAKHWSGKPPTSIPLIDFPDSQATEPERKQLQALRQGGAPRLHVVRRELLHTAVRSGLGLAFLPAYMLQDEPELVVHQGLNAFVVDVWLVINAGMRKAARVRAVADFLEAELRPLLNG
ncbi:MAG TPA: LysR family transcriptional regulator [Oligoflexus sp.]|uniref:LysR family transcriptional regulator n=1 Tax=Oligoflexus sp. TaxID=1971216 RepID=UPI002D23DD59|nr:LysR family transcriptional regulator [Oligoflexus sp.]HYX37223.1 LysR family transcriptional regulator [Oligoflexus sp.]